MIADRLESSKSLNELAAETKLPAWAVSRLLRRSGFYHGAADGQPIRSLWTRLRPHLASRRARTTVLLLLDGCRFPVDRLPVPGGIVQRLTPAQIEALGPPPRIASAFFPKEQLDPRWFSQQWFLCLNRVRDEGPTRITVPFGHDFLGEYWMPLLPLALYDVTGFNVPIVLEASRGWRLRFIRSGEPMIDADLDGNEVPASVYSISNADLPRLRSFLRFVTSASRALHASSLAKSVSRRYLRGVFVSGPFPDVADPDDAEDALLQLTFGLEKLLLGPGEHEAIGDKLALRAAYLVGLGDDKRREEVYAFVKQLYKARSGIVHGGKRSVKSGDQPSAWKIRGLARDVLVAFVAVCRHGGGDNRWREILRRLPFSRTEQGLVARLVQRPLRLVRAPR
jgi:hypothetical protein